MVKPRVCVQTKSSKRFLNGKCWGAGRVLCTQQYFEKQPEVPAPPWPDTPCEGQFKYPRVLSAAWETPHPPRRPPPWAAEAPSPGPSWGPLESPGSGVSAKPHCLCQPPSFRFFIHAKLIPTSGPWHLLFSSPDLSEVSSFQ